MFFQFKASGFTEDQKLIIKSLIDRFHIKHCILASSTNYKLSTFNDFKLLSDWNIFSTVKNPKELHHYTHHDLHYLGTSSVGSQNKRWESMIKLTMPRTLIIFQDSSVDSIIRLYSYYSTIALTAPYFTWVAFLKKSEERFLSKIKIPFNVEFIVVIQENETMYKLNEVYLFLQKVPYLINYGAWDQKYGLRENKPGLSFYGRRLNMSKAVFYAQKAGSHVDQVSFSYHEEILSDLAKIMNITIEYRIKRPPREIWAIRDPLYMISHSTYAKELVGPILKISSYSFIKEPNATASNLYFLLPFSNQFWFALLAFIVQATILHVLIHLIFKFKYLEESISWIDSTFKTFETFCSQSGGNTSGLYTSRIIDYIINLFFVIIISAFSATLQSHLITTITPPPYNNFDELLQDNYSVTVMYGAYEILYFKNSPDPYYQKVYKILWNSAGGLKVGSAKACNQKHAVITYEHNIRNISSKCTLSKIKEPLLTRLSAIRFSENTYGIKGAFAYKLHWFFSSGIVNKMQKGLKSFEKESHSADYFPVEKEQIPFVMGIIAAGIFLSFILLIIELSVKKCWKNNKKIFLETGRHPHAPRGGCQRNEILSPQRKLARFQFLFRLLNFKI